MQRVVCSMGAALCAMAVVCAPAQAQFTWTGTSGSGPNAKAATAKFDKLGGDLVVTLTNIATTDVDEPTDVLTAVFFSITGGDVSLTRGSATLAANSFVIYDPEGQPAGGVVGGEWAYKNGLSGAPGSNKYGISSTGVDLFGPGDRFPGPNLAGPDSPDGVQYGLLSAGDDPSTGNGGITGSDGLINNSVVFTLGGLGAGFDLSRITSVWFQYGTALSEPSFPGQLPAPGSLGLLGLAGLAAARRRRA